MTFMPKVIYYCYLIYLTFKIFGLKIYELDPRRFLPTPGLAWQAALKMTQVKPVLLTNTNMLVWYKQVLQEEYVALFIDA